MLAKYLPPLLIIIVFAACLLIYRSRYVYRRYLKEAEKRLQHQGSSENPILTGADTAHLPEAVQKYLVYTGVIGKEKVQNFRVVCSGEMKLDPQKGWIDIKSEQYNFLEEPARLFFIKAKMFGLSILGLDSYIHGKGNMLIKAAGLFTVSDARGRHMDQGAAVTLFNDMCLLAPATLIDDRILWESLDPRTVKATFSDNQCQVSAVLYFNEIGELINFSTDDRSYTNMDNSYKNMPWSTPVSKYKDFNGFNLASYGEAIWHTENGDYCYAKFNFQEIEYNQESFH